MGFVERLRQEEALKLAAEQKRVCELEVAEQKAKGERIIQAQDASKENRRFLETHRIPGCLQAIIDEEGLEGAYVFWWLKAPQVGQVAKIESGFTRISLVWNIGYIEQSYSRPAERIDGSWLSPGGGGTYPAGYAFKAVNVDGNAEKGLLVVHGATKIDEKWMDTSHWEGGRRYVADYPPRGIDGT